MKKALLKICTSCLTLILLTSCSGGKAVMSYKTSELSENEFIYYLATYKGSFMKSYRDIKNTPEYFNSEVSAGVTAEEYLYGMAVDNMKRTLICNYLFHENGLRLPDGTEKQIDGYITDYINEYSDGNKNAFNAALSEYGINASMLKDIYLQSEYVSAVFNSMYGSNGTTPLTDTERLAYLNENYVRIKHLYVNNKYVYKTDVDGYPVYTDNGTRETEPMSGAELEAKNALISAIDEAFTDGGSFDEIYETFSEDKYYKNGYYLTRNTDFISDVVSSAFELDYGKYVKLESDFGTHYIIRLELDSSPWSDDDNKDFFENYDTSVAEYLFNEYLESLMPEVEVNSDIIAAHSITTSPINYRF